jgi:hypothetical protein
MNFIGTKESKKNIKKKPIMSIFRLPLVVRFHFFFFII